jgi:hypothetical protein
VIVYAAISQNISSSLSSYYYPYNSWLSEETMIYRTYHICLTILYRFHQSAPTSKIIETNQALDSIDNSALNYIERNQHSALFLIQRFILIRRLILVRSHRLFEK